MLEMGWGNAGTHVDELVGVQRERRTQSLNLERGIRPHGGAQQPPRINCLIHLIFSVTHSVRFFRPFVFFVRLFFFGASFVVLLHWRRLNVRTFSLI